MMKARDIQIADLFCGAGGTSTGAVEAAELLGYRPKLTAINHWDTAIATHTANHPRATHLLTAIDNVNPRDLYSPGELDLLWASPECTHHSVARGGKPINEQSRATAWCVVRWADAVQPAAILVENVPEFISWGGIGSNGRPLKCKRGKTFIAWITALESLGYRVDWRVLCAADYGDPTTRKRLFIQAVRGHRKIIWPEPTHAKNPGTGEMFEIRKPWVAAREIIDWNLEGQSIYERKRPLSSKTMRRIYTGLTKFGLRPFIIPQQGDGLRSTEKPAPVVTTIFRIGLAEPFIIGAGGPARTGEPQSVDSPLRSVLTKEQRALVSPFLIQTDQTGSNGDCVKPITKPLGAVVTKQNVALCEPFIVKLRGGEETHLDKSSAKPIDEPVPSLTTGRNVALAQPFLVPSFGEREGQEPRYHSVDAPLPTVAATGHIAVAEPFLIKFYGAATGAQSVKEPLDTVTAKDRHALVRPIVQIDGQKYVLDIRFRMLQPHELAGAQGFPRDYKFTGTKTEQVKLIGNAVPRRLARAIVYAVLNQDSNCDQLLSAE
jgi:DNA (cytosine-5)-methyltransferase 1